MRIVSDQPEPGLWRPVSPSDVSNWRKAAFDRVAGGRRRVVERTDPRSGVLTELHGRGGVYMQDIVRSNGEPTEGRGDEADVELEPIRGIRQHRETVEELTRQTIEWVRSDPALYQERLRIVVRRAQAIGAMSGMTEEEGMAQLHELARKVAEANAADSYASVPQFANHFWKG